MAEAEFHLASEERATLQADLDHDALEAFLRSVPEETRPFILRFARDWSGASPEEVLAAFPEIAPKGPLRRQTFLLPQFEDLATDDTETQAAIDAVLAPRRAKGRPTSPEA